MILKCRIQGIFGANIAVWVAKKWDKQIEQCFI